MTKTQRYLTMCDTCGETFRSATMRHLDTAPECGDCFNDRHADLIRFGWESRALPSEPCDHPDQEMTHDGIWCPDCDKIIFDVDALRYDAELERAALMDDHRYG